MGLLNEWIYWIYNIGGRGSKDKGFLMGGREAEVVEDEGSYGWVRSLDAGRATAVRMG